MVSQVYCRTDEVDAAIKTRDLLIVGLLIREAFSFWTGHPFDFELWVRTGFWVTHGLSPYGVLPSRAMVVRLHLLARERVHHRLPAVLASPARRDLRALCPDRDAATSTSTTSC